MMASELLEHLLAATPYPPDGDADAILVAYRAMFERREELRADLRGVVIDCLDPECVRELARREDAWKTTLTAARETVRTQRTGVAKVRAYAR